MIHVWHPHQITVFAVSWLCWTFLKPHNTTEWYEESRLGLISCRFMQVIVQHDTPSRFDFCLKWCFLARFSDAYITRHQQWLRKRVWNAIMGHNECERGELNILSSSLCLWERKYKRDRLSGHCPVKVSYCTKGQTTEPNFMFMLRCASKQL